MIEAGFIRCGPITGTTSISTSASSARPTAAIASHKIRCRQVKSAARISIIGPSTVVFGGVFEAAGSFFFGAVFAAGGAAGKCAHRSGSTRRDRVNFRKDEKTLDEPVPLTVPTPTPSRLSVPGVRGRTPNSVLFTLAGASGGALLRVIRCRAEAFSPIVCTVGPRVLPPSRYRARPRSGATGRPLGKRAKLEKTERVRA
jgi:hypothetical protein